MRRGPALHGSAHVSHHALRPARAAGTLLSPVRVTLRGRAPACGDGDRLVRAPSQASPEEELLVATSDFLPALARFLGPGVYAPIFHEHHFPGLARYAAPAQAAPVRATAVGCMAEVVEALGSHAGPVAAQALALAARELRGSDSESRRNAAFLAGITAEACPDAAGPTVTRLLEALQGVLVGATRDEDPGARDNALGAICRIALAPCGAGLPLAPVLAGVLSREWRVARVAALAAGQVAASAMAMAMGSLPQSCPWGWTRARGAPSVASWCGPWRPTRQGRRPRWVRTSRRPWVRWGRWRRTGTCRRKHGVGGRGRWHASRRAGAPGARSSRPCPPSNSKPSQDCYRRRGRCRSGRL